MNKITTAIIPVAGYGSRMLPITKAIEKCMLPVLNRPIIDYVVADCIAAGVLNIIFVIEEGSEQIRKYYSHNVALEQYLYDHNKEPYLPLIKPPKNVKFAFVEQAMDGKYGTAIPVSLASHFVNDQDQVLVLMGDDFIWNKDGSSEISRLVNAAKNSNEACMLGVSVEPREVSKYGVIKSNADGLFESIIEKPSVDRAPSNLINISKYLLPTSLIKQIALYAEKEKDEGEYFIIDPINYWVNSGGVMRVVESKGKYFDGGNFDGWLAANVYLSKNKS